LLAAPATHAYGALSVFIQAIADVELARVLPPSVFWPKPKVDSAVVRIVSRSEKRIQIANILGFQEFIRAAFAHRRKMLRGVLAATYPKDRVDQALQELTIVPTARAEEIAVPQWGKLFDALKLG
jgi:16S rRNA (adenine1518-N6/adenine1519-N6)-dimethyltransferase